MTVSAITPGLNGCSGRTAEVLIEGVRNMIFGCDHRQDTGQFLNQGCLVQSDRRQPLHEGHQLRISINRVVRVKGLDGQDGKVPDDMTATTSAGHPEHVPPRPYVKPRVVLKISNIVCAPSEETLSVFSVLSSEASDGTARVRFSS
jgi:hypothetical protein